MKEQIYNWIDTALPLAIELETELTKYPAVSPESGGEGELDKCVFLETWLRAQGITQLERYDAPDECAKGGIRPNLVATLSGSDRLNNCLWIISHLDVVPPGEASLWKTDPWIAVEANDGPLGHRLIGRGTEDNQQGLVSSVLAVLALIKSGYQPQKTIKLLFASDEETGSAFGIGWLLEHSDLFHKGDVALIPDGGDKKGESIEIAEKNLLWIRFVTKGAQTHGSTPDQGINAHLAGADLAVQLHYRLSKKFGDHDDLFEPDYSTFEPTKKEANVPNINTIPGEDVFCMDMRILPRYSVQAVLAEVDRIIADIAAQYKVTIEYSIVQSSESPPTSPDAALILSLSAAVAEVYGVSSRLIGIGGGTVAAYLRRAGIDCAVWSKVDESLHQPNEYVLLDNILGDAKVMAQLIMGTSKN